MSREELHWKLDGAANIVRAVQCLLDERKKPVGNVNTSVGDVKKTLLRSFRIFLYNGLNIPKGNGVLY